MKNENPAWIVYFGLSTWSDEADMLTVGHSGEGDYRSYIKQMVVVWTWSFPTKELAMAAEKAAEKWLEDHGYTQQRVRYDRTHFKGKSPNRTNKWYLVPCGLLGPRGAVMHELMRIIKRGK